MHPRFVLFCALAVSSSAPAQSIPPASPGAIEAPAPAPASPLDAYRWKKRVLLILTPTLDDARYTRQAAALVSALPEITAREVEVIVALPGDARRTRLPLRTDDFMIALIGLDGGLKLSRRDLLAPAALLREIDSMPLRRSELKSAERARQKGDPAAALTAAEMKHRFWLAAPAAGGGWEAESLRTADATTRCWLFDWPVRPGPLRTFDGGAMISFLGGDTVELLVLRTDGTSTVITLGHDFVGGQTPQARLQPGDTVSVRLKAGGIRGWALLSETAEGTSVVPENRIEALAVKFPVQAAWIRGTSDRMKK